MMGWSMAGAGDVNGDGINHMIFGAPLADNGLLVDAGMSIVLYGKTSEFADLDVDSMTGLPGGERLQRPVCGQRRLVDINVVVL